MAKSTPYTLMLLIPLAICAGIVVLQICLSRKDGKWPGLILPSISFAISVMVLISVVLFTAYTATEETVVDGEVVELITTEITSASTILGTAAFSFLSFNIPTAILLAIYAACRGKRDRLRALEKMRLQDME